MGTEKVVKSSPMIGLAARLVVQGCGLLPVSWARAIGAAIGAALWQAPTKLRLVTKLNLDMCLPELAPARRAQVARRSLVETGKMFFETGAVWGRSPSGARPLIEQVVGESELGRAAARGKGVVVLLPHIGNWEVVNHFLMERHPFVALYRAPRIRELDGLIRRARERTGCEMAPADRRGVRQLYTALRDGKAVIILPDQEPVRASGVFAPFFGVPALTLTLVPRLLRKTGASAVLCYAERRPRGMFRVHVRRAPEGLDDADVETALARMNSAVEACVRDCPEQYQWSYKRFRSRPEGEVGPYRAKSLSDEEIDRLDPVVRERLFPSPDVPTDS